MLYSIIYAVESPPSDLVYLYSRMYCCYIIIIPFSLFPVSLGASPTVSQLSRTPLQPSGVLYSLDSTPPLSPIKQEPSESESTLDYLCTHLSYTHTPLPLHPGHASQLTPLLTRTDLTKLRDHDPIMTPGLNGTILYAEFGNGQWKQEKQLQPD